MAALSDQLVLLAILALALAMAAFAAQNALAKDRIRQPAPAAGVAVATRAPNGGGVLAARAGFALTVVAVLAQAGAVVTRGVAAERVPWGNMYEFLLVVNLVGVAAWLGLAWLRPALRPLGLYVALTAVVLLGLSGLRLYTGAGPLVPALDSYWLKIHVSAAALATGVLLVGFVAATLHLLRGLHDRRRTAGRAGNLADTLGRQLPAADNLERWSFRLHVFAFPIWTFAVLAGAVWAEAAWGRYWAWDPKEVWAFISWVVYAAYLHARATPSISRAVTSWLAVAGWATMMINLFAINLVVAGLHSYAGVD